MYCIVLYCIAGPAKNPFSNEKFIILNGKFDFLNKFMDIFGCADIISNVQARTLPSIQVSGGMVWYCIVLYFIKITMDNSNKKLFDIFDLCNKANALTYLI